MARKKRGATSSAKRRGKARGKAVGTGKSRTSKATRLQSKTGRQWMELFAVFALVVGLWLPSVVVLPGIADEFRLPKLAVSEGLLLLSVVFLALSRAGFSRYARGRTLALIVLPMFAVALLSVVFGSHPHHGRIALWNFGLGLIVTLAWSTRKLKVEQVLTWMVWPAVLAAGLIVAQRAGLWQPFELETQRSRLQLTALVGNVGEAALFVSLPLAVCWLKAYRWALDQQWLKTGFWTACGSVLLAAVLLSETATAIAAAALGLAVLGLLLPMRIKIRGALVGAALLLVVAILLLPAGQRVRAKGMDLVQGDLASLTTGRTDGWSAAGHMLKQNPILGVGFGAYGAEFTLAKESQIAAGVTFFDKHVGKSTFSNAHSEPLEWAAETGWFGLLLLLGATAAAGLAVWNKYMRPPAAMKAGESSGVVPKKSRSNTDGGDDQREFALQRALVAATLATLILSALTYFPLRTALLAYPVAILLAAMLGGADLRSVRRSEQSVEDGAVTLNQTSNAWLRWMPAAITVLLLASSLWVSNERIRSSARLLSAESIAGSMAEQNRVYPTVLRPMMEPLTEAGEATPWDERIPLAMGSFHLLLREPEQAIAWYEKSVAIAPRPETLFNLGRALYRLERHDEAVTMFARSVTLDPLRRRYVPEEIREEVIARSQLRPDQLRSQRGRRAKTS